jgi:LacI family transcriptional regulator
MHNNRAGRVCCAQEALVLADKCFTATNRYGFTARTNSKRSDMTLQKPSRRQRSGPTINDVADHAGVSPMTVSRVINGGQTVRLATRERVQAAIAELNYAPSPAARTLAGGEETRIALLYSNPSAFYLSEFLMGSLDQASRLNVLLAVEKFSDDMTINNLVSHLKRGQVVGIVLPSPLSDSDEMIEALQAADICTVAVAAGKERQGVPTVSIDDQAAAGEMTRHLLSLGHRRIGFIKGNPDLLASHARFLGYQAALADAGVPFDPDLVAQGYFTYRSGRDAADRILDQAFPPTAIFASNDDMAAATVAIAHGRGLDVPSDLTVCGFDDTQLATTIWPELTTIRQPISDMARNAVDLLVRQIRNHQADDAVRHIQLDYQLVRRQSDAPPRRSRT